MDVEISLMLFIIDMYVIWVKMLTTMSSSFASSQDISPRKGFVVHIACCERHGVNRVNDYFSGS